MVVKTLLGDMIGCHIWHSGWYEPHVIQALRPLLTPETRFFDIGANIGQYTLFASPLVREVHSFEASPATFKFLSWNVEHNHLRNVRIHQKAVSDHDGTVVLSALNRSNTGDSHIQRAGTGTVIPCVSLDSYLRTLEPARRTVAKIDVEGAEMLVLSGAGQFLRLRPIIMIEVIDSLQQSFGHSADKLRNFIAAHGYELSQIDETNLFAFPVG